MVGSSLGLAPMQIRGTRAVKEDSTLWPTFLALRALLAATQAEIPNSQAL